MADVIRGISSYTLINCLNASSPHQVILPNLSSVRKVVRVPDSKVAGDFGASLLVRSRKELCSLKVHAAFVQAYNQQKWWERNAPNMIDIHSEEEFSSALSEAGDRLVIVEFYGTWCGSCRALFPRLCRTAEEHPEILFLKVNFDENKEMSKSMDVKVLPYFQFYRGADNRLDAFSCSLVQFQKIRGAIALHNPKPCSNGSILVNGDHKLDQATLVKEEPAESAAS